MTDMEMTFDISGKLRTVSAPDTLTGLAIAQAITDSHVSPLASYLFAGTGNATSFLNMSPGITLGVSPFTVEMWFNSTNVNQQVGLFGDGETGALQIYIDNGGDETMPANGFQVNFQGGGQISYVTDSLAANTWYHLAVVRDADNNASLYLNGVAASPVAYSDTNNYGGAITGFGNNYKGSWQGYISNLRVSNVARYNPTQSTITVPTSLFTTDANTLALFDGTFLDGTDATGNQTVTQGGSGTAVALSDVVPTL
jgi:hypothetical protein